MTINAVDRPPDIPVGKVVKRDLTKEKKVIKKVKNALTFDQSKRPDGLYDQYKEKYTFDDQELEAGAIAENQPIEIEPVPIVDQNYVKDDSYGQDEFKDQPLSKNLEQEAWWNMDAYEDKFPTIQSSAPSWNWRQDSFFDSNEYENFKQGFMNENLFGILLGGNRDYHNNFPIDPTYNVFEDEAYNNIIDKNWNYFKHSTSQQQTQHLVNQFYKDREMYQKPYWQIFGAVAGGFTDPTALYLFSRFAKPLWQTGRWNRIKKTTAMLAPEEAIKQVASEERKLSHGATILGFNALFQLVIPAFKGKMSLQDKEALKNMVHQLDLQDELDILNKVKSKKIKVVFVDDTGKWRKPNGNVVKTNKYDVIHPTWTQRPVSSIITKDGVVIQINKQLLSKQFKNKQWTKWGMPKNKFKTEDDYKEFVINVETAEKHMVRKTGESLADFEKRTIEKALTKQNIILGKNNSKDYIDNRISFLDDLEGEQFVPTWLGKFGEKSDWNPIQRAVNRGNLMAIRFVDSIIKSPLIKIKNTMGISSPASLEQLIKADTYYLGTAMEEVAKLFKNYKKSLKVSGGTAISRKEFHLRISKGLVNPKYKDPIPEIVQATQKVKAYYKEMGEKVKRTNPALNTQEMLVNILKAQYVKFKKSGATVWERKFTYQDGTIKTKRLQKSQFKKMIAEEEQYLDALRKNPLRENYLNRAINREKIQANIPAWRDFAMKSLARTMPELSEEARLVIVKSYENKRPWQQFKKGQSGKTHEEEILLNYLFKPSGMSGNLKKRKLKIDQEEWMDAGYFHGDALFLMQLYHKSVLPDVYLTGVFGTPNAMGGQYLRSKGYRAGLKDVEAEYIKKWNKAKTQKEKNAIKKEMDEALEDLEAVRDLFKGTYGVSDDPSSFYSKGISMLKLFNAMTSLQGGLASIVDLGRSVFANGMQRSLQTTWESFTKNYTKNIYKMTKAEGRLSGELFEMQLNTRAMIFNDLNQFYDTGSTIHAGMQKMAGAFFMVNLMTPWNQMIKTHQTLMITTRILEECDNWIAGTITQANKNKLTQAGIDLETAKDIIMEYVEFGIGAGATNTQKLNYARLANSHDWINKKTAKKFQLAVQNDLNIGIITPSLGDTPLWMSTQLGGVLAQFKKFSMGMTNRMLVRGFQEKDANFFGSVVMMVALGGIIDAIRTSQMGGDYSQKSYVARINDAFERSGVGGIFMDINNSGQRLLFDDIGGKLGGVLGPTGSNVDKFMGFATADGSDEMASNVRRLIPFQNIWYLDSLFDRIEQGMQ